MGLFGIRVKSKWSRTREVSDEVDEDEVELDDLQPLKKTFAPSRSTSSWSHFPLCVSLISADRHDLITLRGMRESWPLSQFIPKGKGRYNRKGERAMSRSHPSPWPQSMKISLWFQDMYKYICWIEKRDESRHGFLYRYVRILTPIHSLTAFPSAWCKMKTYPREMKWNFFLNSFLSPNDKRGFRL